MSLKKILGLSETDLTDYEIVARIQEARKNNLDEVDFAATDGTIIRIFIPSIPNFDSYMDFGSWFSIIIQETG